MSRQTSPHFRCERRAFCLRDPPHVSLHGEKKLSQGFVSSHARIQMGRGPHLVEFVSHDHLYGQRGRVLAFFELQRDGVEGFAICHVVNWSLIRQDTHILANYLIVSFCVYAPSMMPCVPR